MKPKTYVVQPPSVRTTDDARRLVRAKGRAAVFAHIAREYLVEYADQDTMADLIAAGVRVEDAVTAVDLIPVPDVIEDAP